MNRAALMLSTLVFIGCSASVPTEKEKPGDRGRETKPSASSEHKDEPEHEELPKRVHASREVIDAAKIKSAPAGREVLQAVIELPGELTSDPDRTARVTTPIAGRLDKVSFTEGQAVEAHQLLALVRVPDLADRQAALSSASARATASTQNAARLEVLVAKGLAAQQELADAKAQLAAVQAEARAAAERIRAVDARPGSVVELRAPIAGVVLVREAVVGQPADPDKPIATIADLSEVWFVGRLFESDLARVRFGAAAEVQLNAYPKERFEGSISLIGRQVDPVARTVVARVPLRNRDDLLRLGLFGTARIAAGDPADTKAVLAVAQTAITEINGKPYVFVQHPDDDFELHPVVIGRAALGRVEIQSGLREGERVVVDGVFTLKSLVLKSTIAEEE